MNRCIGKPVNRFTDITIVRIVIVACASIPPSGRDRSNLKNLSSSKLLRGVLIGETLDSSTRKKPSIFKPTGHGVRLGCVEMPRDVLNERKYVAAAVAVKRNRPDGPSVPRISSYFIFVSNAFCPPFLAINPCKITISFYRLHVICLGNFHHGKSPITGPSIIRNVYYTVIGPG